MEMSLLLKREKNVESHSNPRERMKVNLSEKTWKSVGPHSMKGHESNINQNSTENCHSNRCLMTLMSTVLVRGGRITLQENRVKL